MHNLTDFDNHVHPYTDIEVSYSWEVYDEDGRLQFVSQEPEPKIEFTQQGNYHILLIATTSTGCIDSLMKPDYIHSVLQPHVEFIAIPETAFLSDSGIYFLNFADTTILADENTVWYWDFGDGTIDSSSYSPTHHYDEWGDYEVVFYVSNGLGCNDRIAHLVSIEADLMFPNVITPNGDGLNDVFAIENLNTRINSDDPSQFRTNLLAIFNRWGKKVYEAENYDTYVKDGDITVGHKAFGGENCPDGTYYYTFYYKGKLQSVNVNGTLMILREAQKSK
jgi:gliding motility-associated-like protein